MDIFSLPGILRLLCGLCGDLHLLFVVKRLDAVYTAGMSEEQFISEPIQPVVGTADAAAMARGEPGLPKQFTWRGTTFTIASVLQAWKRSEPERHKPGNERYLRRHYWTVETTDGQSMTLYCLRSAKPGQHRWFLYTINA